MQSINDSTTTTILSCVPVPFERSPVAVRLRSECCLSLSARAGRGPRSSGLCACNGLWLVFRSFNAHSIYSTGTVHAAPFRALATALSLMVCPRCRRFRP